MLESIAISAQTGGEPAYPAWLATTQVRIVPVSDDEIPFAQEICDRILATDIRADIDDREETVGKKIRNAERDWVPYTLVVGPRERETGVFSVRRREERDQVSSDLDGILTELGRKVDSMPRRKLSLPPKLGERPIFYG